MKNVFIGLLIAAAGAGAYFFLIRKEKPSGQSEGLRKEWFIGQWKIVTPGPVTDSASQSADWDFRKNGLALMTDRTARTDTFHFAWKNERSILITAQPGDSSGREYQIIQLSADSMQWKGTDEQSFQLLKVK